MNGVEVRRRPGAIDDVPRSALSNDGHCADILFVSELHGRHATRLDVPADLNTFNITIPITRACPGIARDSLSSMTGTDMHAVSQLEAIGLSTLALSPAFIIAL